MIGSEYFATQLRLATVVVPVAVYFLILGLLNSRKHPQLITARQDFILLMAALSPLVIFPLFDYLNGPVLGFLAIVVAAITVGSIISTSSGSNWVIYNLTYSQAQQALEQALADLNIRHVRQGRRIDLPDDNAFIEISSFSLLRNISIRLRHGNLELSRRISNQLSVILEGTEAHTSSMAVGLLIVATAMLVAPAFTVVHRAPEIVRVLTDLLN